VNATSNIDQRMGVLSIGRKNMFGKQKSLEIKIGKWQKKKQFALGKFL